MNLKNKITKNVIIVLAICLVASCQKLERPALKELILDPPPPAYSDLKTLLSFENNLTDEGENKFSPASNNISYIDGVNGKAVKFGDGGYILFNAAGDTVTYPNGFKGVPSDTLKSLGSFTISWWMNGVGPVKNGAEGVMAFSNKNEFWGNLEMFLENNPNGDDNEAYLKIHMFNAGVGSGNGEEWNEIKLPNALNKWTYLALTYDAGTSNLNLFMDGQPTAIANKTLGGGKYGKLKFKDFNGLVLGTYQFQTTPSLTNHGPETWAKSFNGAFDQFRIYNRALTATEITDLFTTKK